MYQRHDQSPQQSQVKGIDNTLGKLDNIVGRVERVAERYARPPGERPDKVPTAAPVPIAYRSGSTRVQSEHEDSIPAYRATAEPSVVPQPTDKPRNSRRSQRSQQQQDGSETAVVSPPMEAYKPVSTRRFLIETFASLYSLGSVAVIFSSKFLGSYAAFSIPVALVAGLLWTPGVVAGLFCVGLYARHTGKHSLLERVWMITLVFAVVKVFSLLLLGGAW